MSNEHDKSSRFPQPTIQDHVHTATKVLAEAFLPGGASAILAAIIPPPIEKRRDAFFEELARRVDVLAGRGVAVHALANNDEFIDAVIQAAQSWVRTSRREKRDALLNAVTSVALGRAAGGDINSILFRYIDELTPSHLRLLEFLREPRDWYAKLGLLPPASENMQRYIVEALPEFHDAALLHGVWHDLRSRDLVPDEHLVLHERPKHYQLKGLAHYLLRFIREVPAEP